MDDPNELIPGVLACDVGNSAIHIAGVKGDDVATCAMTAAPQAEVHAAMALGKAMGVSGTPMLFVNGRKIAGLGQLPYEVLKRLVEFEVSEAKKAPPAPAAESESEPKE